MKKNMKPIWLLSLVWGLSACVPEAPVPNNNGNALHNQTHELAAEIIDLDAKGIPGFSGLVPRFVKFDKDGNALGESSATEEEYIEAQTWVWDDNGTEANGRKWSCVLDWKYMVMWEVKQNDNGLRDQKWKYMNTTAQAASGNWDPIIDGGMDNGTCYADPDGNISATCDTEAYVAEVRASNLCNLANTESAHWQLPSGNILDEVERELMDVLENGDINQIAYYFPNSPVDYHWSRSPNENASDQAWAVHSRIFGDGAVNDKELALPVRLVHPAPF